MIAASALTEGNSLVLKGPFPFPWTKMKQKLIACGYIHSCTLPALIKLGVTGFCWLGSRQSTGMEEYLEGNEPAPDGSKWKYGAFLYLYENHPEYDCFFPVAAISKWEETMLHLHCYAASTGKGKGFDLSNLAKERSDFKNRSLGTAEKAQNLLDSATISSCEDITELQFNGMCMATFVGGIFKLLHMTLRPTHDISLTVRPNQFSKRFREIYRFPFSSLHNYETTLHEMLPAVYHDGLARMLGNRKGLKNIFNEIEELDSTLSQIQAKLVELVPAYQYSDIIIVVPRNVENEEDLAALFPGSVPKCFRSEDKIRSSGRSIRLGETPEDMNSGAESEEPVDVDKPANDATDKTVRL